MKDQEWLLPQPCGDESPNMEASSRNIHLMIVVLFPAFALDHILEGTSVLLQQCLRTIKLSNLP